MPSSSIELIQLSAQVQQHFAPLFSSDDKLAGMSLNRFGAFLKRSWRANDWIWGRMDAIKIAMQVVLTPESVRNLAQTADQDESPEVRAELVVDGIGLAVFDRPTELDVTTTAEGSAFEWFRRQSAETQKLYVDAKGEVLASIHGSEEPLRSLASLAAYGVQTAAAGEDVPWLAEAIHDDDHDGATGSKSAGFLARFDGLQRASASTTATTSTTAAQQNYELLKLFAKSGIGQESVGEELPSDLMVRTAATAAATAVTVLGAERPGLNVAKPASKLLRGVIAAPYWIVVGLTHRGQFARVAAATVLALGISLVTLSLRAPLPGIMSPLVPTLGVGSILTVFAYAALRSRSVVHGAALLGLFVPLLALTAHRLWSAPSADTVNDSQGPFRSTVQESGFAIIAVLVLIVGTVAIANIDSPVVSPLAKLGRVREWLRRLRCRDAPAWVKRKWKQIGVVVLAAILAVWAGCCEI